MPRFSWDEQSLRWYSDFSRYTGFHEKLAELLRPGLAGCETLCDVGCGAGLVDVYLSPGMGRLTCVDRSAEAVAFLRRECAARGISNLTALDTDCEEVSGSWDAVLFSFFGMRFIERFLPRCRRLIAVLGDDDTHGLLPGAPKRTHSAAQFRSFLEEKKHPYSVRYELLEAGQPFSDAGEAVRFVRHYSGCTNEQAREFLSSHLQPAGREGFAYYLPRSKPIAIFTVAGGLG